MEQIWLNIASSTEVEPDFINLDNHVWLWASRLPRPLTKLIPGKYRGQVEKYRSLRTTHNIQRHDCRKALRLSDESVDHILCSHFLEHV